MSFSLKMNSSKILFIIGVITLMMLFVLPVQSMSINDGSVKLPTRHKRWTFNTWRLHGRRQLSNGLYFPKTSNDDHHYEMFNNENDTLRKIHERLLQLLRELNQE